MQLFGAVATMFFFKIFFFAHKKLKKPPSKVAQKNSNPLFFSLTASIAQMAQNGSKMWPIDQLYIELGITSITKT